MADDDDKKLKTGRFSRLAKLATMSAKLSGDVVSRGMKRLTGTQGDDASILGAGAAEKLVATLGDLKGLAMKIGQQMSMDPELLTPEVRRVIARLQNQAPPMPFSQVEEVIRSQLGKAPLEAFATFDEKPMASASLGQVHGATTHDGQKVAVKVQYPDIARALQSDLDNLGTMVNVFAASTRLTQGKSYFAEIRESMMDELDYRQEAERALRFEAASKVLPDLKVPRCLRELTAEKVLTLEFIEGPTLKEFINALPEDNAERFRVSRLVMRAVWGPFMVAGLIHSDPHPGNFILMADGRVGVLDFGAIKQLSPAWVDVNHRLFRHVVKGETFDAVKLSMESGFQFDDPEGAREMVETVLDIATRPPRSHDFDFKASDITKDMRNLFIKNAPKMGKIKPPRESVQFYRAVGGLSQNLENIGARGDFKKVYEEMLALLP